MLSAAFGLGPPYPLSLAVPVGPVLPFTLRCVPGDGKVTLSWNAQPVTSSGLANGTAYEFRFQAAKWYDRGVHSNVCRATPAA